MENQSKNGNIIAIITMMFLYAMISFVTNLAAPIGVIWKNVFADSGSANMIGMLGNAMNFLAYLFMGIPAGKLLTKIGYKKTALTGIATGFVGVLIQFLSGKFGADISGFAVYLFGAFISGFAVCILNTVVNPMLNLIGGGGNRGNQLNLIGGTLNSLSGTLTPMLVGALIGTVTANTKMVDVNLVLYIALAVFAAAFVILNFIPIQDPEMGKTTDKTVFEHSPWAFRHFNLGVIAIFVYVGVEVGIPGTLNFYISDTTANGGGFINGTALANAAAIGGFVAGTYWLLMLVGRLCSSFIADKVSSRMMMMIANGAGMIFIVLAVLLGKSTTVEMPVFTGTSFQMVTVPIAAMFLVLCGLCTSIMWSSIFNLATEGLGKYTAQASGIFMMMVVGGGLMPLVQNFIADNAGYMASYIVPLICMAYMFFYSVAGCKNINKDIQIGMMCPSVMISGAGNFPVKKKEKQVAAWDKNHEDYKEVEAILGKIEAIFYGKDVIKSDDENAIEKLQDKVDGLREDQERMKQANKAIRMKDKEKGDATLHDMGYTDEQIAQLREPDFCGRIGFPDYMLANNNANIRRLEGRIKSLQKTKSQGTQESENKFFKVKENVEAMRIQLFFEGKPEPEVRDILKSNGFRWAPSVGAWQRQLNNNGKYAVERVIRELEEMEAAE